MKRFNVPKESGYDVDGNIECIPIYDVHLVVDENGNQTEEVRKMSGDEFKKKNSGACIPEETLLRGSWNPDYLSKFEAIDELEYRVSQLEKIDFKEETK